MITTNWLRVSQYPSEIHEETRNPFFIGYGAMNVIDWTSVSVSFPRCCGAVFNSETGLTTEVKFIE